MLRAPAPVTGWVGKAVVHRTPGHEISPKQRQRQPEKKKTVRKRTERNANDNQERKKKHRGIEKQKGCPTTNFFSGMAPTRHRRARLKRGFCRSALPERPPRNRGTPERGHASASAGLSAVLQQPKGLRRDSEAPAAWTPVFKGFLGAKPLSQLLPTFA